MNSYHHETIARQRMDDAARAARRASMFQQGGTRPRRWSFPKVTFPSRPRPRLTPRPV